MKVLIFSICVMIFAGVCFSASDEISVEKNNKEPVMRINDLLEGAGVFYLATSDGDQPKLRPLGATKSRTAKFGLAWANSRTFIVSFARIRNAKWWRCKRKAADGFAGVAGPSSRKARKGRDWRSCSLPPCPI